MFRFFQPKFSLYLAAMLSAFGVFVWASFSGTRLLGDDNESTETRTGPGTHSSSHSGHNSFYHK